MRYDYKYFFTHIFTQAFVDTIFMVTIASILSIIIALIVSVIFYLTNEKGLRPNRIVYNILNIIVNIVRSFPFLILMVSIIPLTRLIVNGQAIECRHNSQNILRNIRECPGSSSGKPTVLCFSKARCVSSGNHLRVNIWFRPMDFTEFFHIGRTSLLIDFKCPCATSNHGFCCRYPRIVVAKDAGIFFISRWVGGDLS